MQENTDWLLSVFHDNSGMIAWDDDWSVCMKVETHTSPSALDPYGGAMTGIVGQPRHPWNGIRGSADCEYGCVLFWSTRLG